MSFKNTGSSVYSSCSEMSLSSGMLVSSAQEWVSFIDRAEYQQSCYQGVPVLNTNVGLIMDKFSQPLPLVQESWRLYTSSHDGAFNYSIVPIIYAISVSAVIIWFLTVFVITNYRRGTWLLKGSCIVSSVYVLVVVVKSILELHTEQREGYLHGAQVLHVVNRTRSVGIIELVAVFLLLVNEVQIVMRLFPRRRDKRVTFYVGVAASVASQVMWSITQFHQFPVGDESGAIMPAFVYLVRIAMALCYAVILTVYIMRHVILIIGQRQMWVLSALTLLFVFSPFGFFVADVSNGFVYELSEVFSVVNYVIGVVIPWEWCNRFETVVRMKEKEGVLGRRFYEEEVDSHRRERLQGYPYNGDGHPNVKVHHKDNMFTTLTDRFIAAAFSIPRSESVTPSVAPAEVKQRNVYVYAAKEVVL